MAMAAALASSVAIRSQRQAMTVQKARDRSENQRGIFSNDLIYNSSNRSALKHIPLGELTTIHCGSAPMKSALDLGDELAVRTLADLDPNTLTSPCCPEGTPLMYLRSSPPDAPVRKLLPFFEKLLLREGFVPFSDGSAIPVDLLTKVLAERREEFLVERVRAGTINFRQFKTLKTLFTLPTDFESTDPSLAYLIRAAKRRDEVGSAGLDGEDDDGFDDYDDDDDEGGWCLIS